MNLTNPGWKGTRTASFDDSELIEIEDKVNMYSGPVTTLL